VYDCVDEHSAYQGFNPQTVKALERRLMARADIVFVTAQGLYQDKKEYCQEIYLSPNGADVDHFMSADHPDTTLAPELEGLSRPVLGFVGAIKEWIDLELLAHAAREIPHCSLIMVGPVGVDVDISALERLPNVYFLGHRNRQDLPRYLKGFDVCLNPFRLTRLTATVSPLKFYEYLASGRPIASVPMPEIKDFEAVVEFGAGPDGFLNAVCRALEDSPSKKARRLEMARQNSWQSRVDFMMDKISLCWEKKKHSGQVTREWNEVL
jgi:glycosyltransferase involved in cell wall biosynthesis